METATRRAVGGANAAESSAVAGRDWPGGNGAGIFPARNQVEVDAIDSVEAINGLEFIWAGGIPVGHGMRQPVRRGHEPVSDLGTVEVYVCRIGNWLRS